MKAPSFVFPSFVVIVCPLPSKSCPFLSNLLGLVRKELSLPDAVQFLILHRTKTTNVGLLQSLVSISYIYQDSQEMLEFSTNLAVCSEADSGPETPSVGH